MSLARTFKFLKSNLQTVHILLKVAHNITEVINMNLGDVKIKDLGKVTSESLKEMGEDILDKTEEKVHEMKEKMDDDKDQRTF